MSSIAIIGQGYMGNAHAAAWASVGQAEAIKYICTPRPKVGSVPQAMNAKYIADLSVILKDREVKFVSVCTPTPTHREIACALLSAGKHVLLEKPIALTIADAEAIADAAEKSTGSLMIAHVVRFFMGYQKLRAVSESGELGTVFSVHARRFSPKPAWAAWLGDTSQSGGMLIDFSIHDFDQLNLYLGKAIEVFAMQTSSDGPAEVTVRYENGGIGHVQSFMNISEGVPFTSTIDLLGTKGMAHYEFSAVSATTESSGVNEAAVNGWHVFSSKGNTYAPIAVDDPYGRQIQFFFEQASSGRSYDLSPTKAAIAALQVSLAARASLTEGRTVTIANLR